MADRTPTNNRMVLLLIGGIPVIMILAATWLWYFVVRGDLDLVGLLGTANRGTLVRPPRQLNERGLQDESGLSVKLGDQNSRWTMVVPASGGRCDETCERNLYVTRQIQVAMGSDANRLRRLYVGTDRVETTTLAVQVLNDGRPVPAGGDFASYLATEHHGLGALTLSPADYGELFPEQSADPSTWYLVDPAGWVMMSYNKDVPYKDVIADLKFLLKNSSG